MVPWVLGGFPRTLRCWEAAGLVTKLSSPGPIDTSGDGQSRVLGGLGIRTTVQLDPGRAQDISLHSHPEVDAHSGNEGTSQESPILEAHKQAGLPHTGIPHQHDLEQTGGSEESGLGLGALPT